MNRSRSRLFGRAGAALARVEAVNPQMVLVDNLPLTNNQRIWAVTQRPSGPTGNVDADTGAIKP